MTELEAHMLLDLLEKAAEHTKNPEHRLNYEDAWWNVHDVTSHGLRIGQEEELEGDDR